MADENAGATGAEQQAAEDKSVKELTKFRFYEEPYPKVDDFVMVEVKRIEEMGAYVVLKEYNDQEGMILLSELSRRRIRSIHKIIRVGRLEVGMVQRVDVVKGYIDVSKRRVSPEDVTACEEKYNKAKAVHLIVSSVAHALNRDIEDVYKCTAWPLYKVHGHAYDAFKLAVSDPETIFGAEPCGSLLAAEPEIKREIIETIRERMSPKALKIRADVEVTCNERAGVEAIKRALRAGAALSTEKIPIEVKLIAAPLYVLTCATTDKQAGLQLISNAVEAIRTKITEEGGKLLVKEEARLVREADDLELADLMAKLSKKQMADGSDNDDSSDDEDGSGSDSESDD